MNPLLDAALLALTAPVALAAAAAAGLLAAPGRTAAAAVLAFCCAFVAIGWWTLPALAVAGVPPATLLLLGAALAWSPAWASGVGLVTGLLGGVAAGLAGGAQTSSLAEAIASSLALSGLLLGALLLRRRAQQPTVLATWLPRVAGAWIAAIGALLLALALRQAGT